MSYLPIEYHGIIGDLHTTALVGLDGTIDWCCLPHFDSPSVFASILDDEIGGWFKISAEDTKRRAQMYYPDTNILITRSFSTNGLGQIEDFMPITKKGGQKVHQIIRTVRCVRGEIKYNIDCRPAFNYAQDKPIAHKHSQGIIFETPGLQDYALKSPIEMNIKDGGAVATFTLKQGESLSFVFFCCPAGEDSNPFDLIRDPEEQQRKTINFWQSWISRCTYSGRWGEMVIRSALTLKLLTFEPTGAIVAAPTMSLPEQIGGVRNWDYRYTWIRDASFTLYAFMRIGYTQEAEAFMEWLSARCAEVDVKDEHPLHLMYGIHGEHILPEYTLDHLKGYKGSKPVRVGNAASNQLQLDIFGELLDSIYLYDKYAQRISYDLWNNVRRITDWVADNWNQPDEGIWETRGGRQNFVYSRLMCWVALDRADRMSRKCSLPGNRSKWSEQRNIIYDEIMDKGWNDKLQSFRQHYDTDALDASNLLMPLVKFISPNDPRMLSTLEATLENLTNDSLVYRYDPKEAPDGLSGDEGTFSICTFWLVECLTRAGKLEEARLIFQKMLGFANHLGLYGEEIGMHGESLGNFPQAFTHLSLISAAYNLDKALSHRR